MQADPAAIGLLLLPGFCDLDDVGILELDAAERGFGELRLILRRRIGVDPVAGLGAERGFLRRVVEIHGATFQFKVIRTPSPAPSLRGALATKQSRLPSRPLDCFAELAMTEQAPRCCLPPPFRWNL